MVDKIQKALNKLNDKERVQIKEVLRDLLNGQLNGYDLKKLKGQQDIYRIRKEKIRIIYRQDALGQIFLLAVERRGDTTYNL
jgi:mRNA-degrading endonuclease RelE of RelBE toxin-antitoxin system